MDGSCAPVTRMCPNQATPMASRKGVGRPAQMLVGMSNTSQLPLDRMTATERLWCAQPLTD